VTGLELISAKMVFMTTNANALSILCYGDSNTWGQKPDKSGRYPANIRWTGRLQELLGNDFYIIEEGLSSRTTDLDYTKKPGRNGKTYLTPCLASHNPLDIIILMLGTNDLKIEFDRSPADIANALKSLLADIRQYATDKEGNVPKILLVSPIHINDQAPDFAKMYGGVNYDAESDAKSRELAGAVEAIADEAKCMFFDASTIASAGNDGIHFNEAAHIALASALEKEVHELAS
jgi:lysophospholipase L1-like esterase